MALNYRVGTVCQALRDVSNHLEVRVVKKVSPTLYEVETADHELRYAEFVPTFLLRGYVPREVK